MCEWFYCWKELRVARTSNYFYLPSNKCGSDTIYEGYQSIYHLIQELPILHHFSLIRIIASSSNDLDFEDDKVVFQCWLCVNYWTIYRTLTKLQISREILFARDGRNQNFTVRTYSNKWIKKMKLSWIVLSLLLLVVEQIQSSRYRRSDPVTNENYLKQANDVLDRVPLIDGYTAEISILLKTSSLMVCSFYFYCSQPQWFSVDFA